MLPTDEIFMQQAIQQARIAFERDEIPVGAVIVHEQQIISRAHNQVEMLKDPTAHAEMLAITQATNFLSNKWLEKCTIYVTLEPCSMCAGALVLARMKRICFGAPDPKTGACGSVLNIVGEKRLNHRLEIRGGICSEICGVMLTEFFKRKRALGKK